MSFRYFLVGLIFMQFLYAHEQTQDQAGIGIIIKDFDLDADKQAMKDMIAFDWDQLCGGYTHGYVESIVDDVLENMGNSCKVLYQDNQFIGFVEYGIKSDNRAHIESLGVHKDYRGKGFGVLLLQYAFEDIASWDIDYVTIDVMLHNDIARNLYENKFKFHPLYVKYYIILGFDQESAPVLSLGRALNISLWSQEAKQEIIAVDETLANMDEMGVMYRMELFDRM